MSLLGSSMVSTNVLEATDLSKTFADQGLKIRVRKDPRRKLTVDLRERMS